MFDSIYLKFNSKQSSTWNLAKEILYTSVKAPILGKRILLTDKSDYITSLAKLGNCCSIVWVHRHWARPVEGQVFQSFLFGGGGKEVTHCITIYFQT